MKKKATKPKKQVKPSVAKLKKKADKYYSLATRLRFADNKDGEWWAKCITCPNYKPIKQMQCGHFMSRANNNTRFVEENTAVQCYGCNVMQQGRQYEFGLQIDLLYGAGTSVKLMELSKVKHQFTTEELQDIIDYSKEQIASYGVDYA